jgi:glutathione S-transferase
MTRFITYEVEIAEACVAYCDTIMALPAMKEWVAAAELEPDDIDELDAEF